LKRLLAWLILPVLAAVAIVFAVANRGPVTIDLDPLPYALDLPLFLAVYLAAFVGLLAGGFLAWLRGHRSRVRAAERAREAERLKRELAAARRDTAAGPQPALPAVLPTAGSGA